MLTRWIPLCIGLGLTCGCGGGLEIEVVAVRRGTIEESFVEPARTRLAQTYVITMPVDARIERVTLEPGDAVSQGTAVVTADLVPFELDVQEAEAAVSQLRAEISVKENDDLESTARKEAVATIDASEEALQASRKQVEVQKRRAEHAEVEFDRLDRAHDAGAVSRSELDVARLARDTAEIEYLRQEFYEKAFHTLLTAIRLGPQLVDDWLGRKVLEREVLMHQLAQAEVRRQRAAHQRQLLVTGLQSPITGVVLEKHEQGDSTLPAGTALLRLGSLEAMEVIAEVLTQDAQRLQVGSAVRLEAESSGVMVPGQVTRIEPMAFTKLSSLGVEQQRVNVIVGLEGERPADLGVGYRLQARFLTGSRSDTLIVDRFSVLESTDGQLYVLAVQGGRLQRRPVEIGLRSDLELEVTSGLQEGDVIVRAPDTTMESGQAVTALAAP
jgi:HlyD family secretion protein